MQNKVRKSMIAVLSCCFMATSAFMINTLSAKADTDTTWTAENCEYNVVEGASMRISSDAYGTGLRFKVKIPSAQYTALKSGENTVKFGVLVAPQEDHEKAPMTADTVFNVNGGKVYRNVNPNANDTDGIYQVQILETEELALDNNGTPENTADDFYFTYASMVAIQPNNVTRQFVAKAYVYEENSDGQGDWYFKDGDTGAFSISYVAQKTLETQSDKITNVMGADAVASVQAEYITGKKGTVEVELVKYYGENAVTSEGKVELPLGTTLDNETVFNAMGFEAGAFEVNDTSAVSGKVYGDNKTAKVTLKVDASEIADYATFDDGYFANANNAVTLGGDRTALVQTVNGLEAGTYKVYADGTVVVTAGQNSYLGVNKDGTVTLSMAGENQVMAKTVELGNVAYKAIAGKYIYNGKLVTINANGTLVYDEETAGYVLAYDETNGTTYLIAGTQTPIVKAVSYADGKYVIADMPAYNLATKADYTAIATEYVVTGGDFDGKILRFAVDGTILQAKNTAGEYDVVGFFELYKDMTVSVTLNDTPYAGDFTQTTTADAINKTISVADGAITFTAKKLTANIYDILGSAEGKKYYHHNTEHYVALYNTKRTDSDTRYVASWQMGTTVVRPDTKFAYEIYEKAENFGVIRFVDYEWNSSALSENDSKNRCCFYYIINGVVILDVNNYGPEASGTGNYLNYKYSDELWGNDTLKSAYSYALEGRVAELNSGLVRENAGAEAEEEVVEKTIYEEIAGAYVQAKSYTGGQFISGWGYPTITLSEKDGGHNFHFSLDGANSAYTLEPITDNFGEIIVNAGRYRDKHAGFYAKVGNEYVLRISDDWGGTSFGKFVDYVKEGSTFTSWGVFDALAGDAKEAGEATSVTYTDAKGNSLVLNNPGNMDNKNHASYTMTWGTNTLTGNYDIIATSATSGKILMYRYNGGSGWNSSVVYGASLYTFADYEIINGKYVIAINSSEFLGGSYVLGASDTAENVIKGALAGEFVGVNGNVTIDDTAVVEVSSMNTGFVTVGDVKYAYVMNGGRVVLTAGTEIYVQK